MLPRRWAAGVRTFPDGVHDRNSREGCPPDIRGVWGREVVRMLRNEYSSMFRGWSGSEEETSQWEAGFLKTLLLRWETYEYLFSPRPAIELVEEPRAQ